MATVLGCLRIVETHSITDMKDKTDIFRPFYGTPGCQVALDAYYLGRAHMLRKEAMMRARMTSDPALRSVIVRKARVLNELSRARLAALRRHLSSMEKGQ